MRVYTIIHMRPNFKAHNQSKKGINNGYNSIKKNGNEKYC